MYLSLPVTRRRPTAQFLPASSAVCWSPTNVMGWAGGFYAKHSYHNMRSGSVSLPRSNAPTTPSPTSCCPTSAASATATASKKRSPMGYAPRPGWRSSVWRFQRKNAPNTSRQSSSWSRHDGSCDRYEACLSNPLARFSQQWRTWPNATTGPMGGQRVTTSTHSRNGVTSWRRAPASTSCSASSHRQSKMPTVR